MEQESQVSQSLDSEVNTSPETTEATNTVGDSSQVEQEKSTQPEVPQQNSQQADKQQDAEVAETTNTYPSSTDQSAEDNSSDDDIGIDDTLTQYNQYYPQPIDVSQLPTDAEGNVDPNAFAQAVYQQAVTAANAQAQQTVAEQLKEQKLWEQVEKAYPELASNKELRAMVHNARLGEMAASLGDKNPTPKQIADKLFKHINSAKASGAEQATNNIKVQQSAALETANNTAPQQDPTLVDAAIAGDPEARRKYLVSLIDSGEIKI